MRGAHIFEQKTEHDALERDLNGSVLLDGKTGRPKLKDEYQERGVIHSYGTPEVDFDGILETAPEHIKHSLDRAQDRFGARGSMQSWEEGIYATIADGAAVTAAAEAIMVPIFTLPANYLYPGRMMKWTVFFRSSTAITTPGTLTYRLAYSATGLGAVVVAASAAFIPDVTAAATNLTGMVEWWAMCRSTGTAGTMIGFGAIDQPDANDVDITNFAIEYEKRMAPQATAATVAIDTTVARSLNPTYQPSLGTASMTAHLAFLEALT